MKKKLIILILSLVMVICGLKFGIFADDIIINEDTELEKYDIEQYIPKEIEDILIENGVNGTEEIDVHNVLETVFSYIQISFSKHSCSLNLIITMIFLSSVLKRIIKNERFTISEGYITTLVHIVAIFGVLSEALNSAKNILISLSDVLSLTLPSLYTILLSSGCPLSAIVSGASVGIALSFINDIIMRVVSPLVYILTVMMLFEKITSYVSDTGIFKIAKNTVMNVLKFITTILLSVISFQSILGASKDSVSMRAIKFAATNFIPIVGGAVSESMRTLSAGFKLLRTSVGGTFIFAMALTVMPSIIEIFLLKTVSRVFSVFCGLLGANAEKSLYDATIDILNIVNAIIIFSLLIALISIVLFITTGFITSY